MKWFARSIVFAGALFFGIGAAAVGLEVRPYLTIRDIEVEGSDPDKTLARNPDGIYVMYAGISKNGDAKEKYLKFIVHNGGPEPLRYVGYWANHSFPRLRANGSDLPDTFICGNGASRYTILPGRSAELHITRDEFLSRPSKNALVEVGFNLPESSDRSTHYSEPFPLPEEFRRTISVK